MHDQTMRFANHGLNAVEIAEQLTLPPEFAGQAAYHRLLRHTSPTT